MKRSERFYKSAPQNDEKKESHKEWDKKIDTDYKNIPSTIEEEVTTPSRGNK